MCVQLRRLLTPYIAEMTIVIPSHSPGSAENRHQRDPPVKKLARRMGALSMKGAYELAERPEPRIPSPDMAN